jgi:two-component system response regulator DesR
MRNLTQTRVSMVVSNFALRDVRGAGVSSPRVIVARRTIICVAQTWQVMRPVLIIEDHPLVAEATGKLLARYGDHVTPVICSDAFQAAEKLDSRADWFRIFLDLDVPGAYGLSLAKEVRQRGLANRCCVVSAFERADYIGEIKAWGFLGYIVKAIAVAEFTAELIKVLAGEPTFPATPLVRRVAATRLTRRQTQLLELIQAGLSSKQIADELHLAEGTVNNQVTSILQVFEVGSRTHAIARAIELGLLETRPHAEAFNTQRHISRGRR